MLPKKNRLPKKDKHFLLSSNHLINKTTTPFFTLLVFYNTKGYTRLSPTISLKVSKKAVVRNRLKRQLINHLKPIIFASAKPLDIILILKPAALKNIVDTKKSLSKHVQQLITKTP